MSNFVALPLIASLAVVLVGTLLAEKALISAMSVKLFGPSMR